MFSSNPLPQHISSVKSSPVGEPSYLGENCWWEIRQAYSMPEDLADTNDKLQIEVTVEKLKNIRLTVILGKLGAQGNRKLVDHHTPLTDTGSVVYNVYPYD